MRIFIGRYYKGRYIWVFFYFGCYLLPYMKGVIFLDVSKILDHKEK